MTVSLLLPVAPALVLCALFFLGLAGFAIRVRRKGFPELPDADRRKATPIATPMAVRYVLWYLTPIERGLASSGVSPNTITLLSLAVCVASGVLAATGHLAAAAWLYMGAGMLDVLDGRVARRTGRISESGALLDSVADRWGEFFVLGGLALAAPDAWGLAAVLVCTAGSQMVSYTRARGEAFGIKLEGGTMQRAERIIVVSLAMIVSRIGVLSGTFDGATMLSVALLAVGAWSAATSIHRLSTGMRALRRDKPAVRDVRDVRTSRPPVVEAAPATTRRRQA
jgi:phosphatidylglycerophosphate synthase